MRAFIAIELSDEMKDELSRLQDKLKPADSDVKWVKPENSHLTLKFLGDIDDDVLGKIKNILDDIARANKVFNMTLFKAGAFPNLNRIRVIWVGIDESSSSIHEIAKSLEAKLEGIGFLKEDRPFSAHLTLGRVRSGKNKEKLKDLLNSVEVQTVNASVDHITLFQSTLTQKGPIYTPLHVAKFKS